jgi:hypothetical protein
LGLSWADAAWLECCPQVKRALPPVSGGGLPVLRALRFGGAAFGGDLQCEVLEFGEQGAEFLRVVEQGLVLGELGG